MQFQTLIETLKTALALPLPGEEAHLRMATKARLTAQPNEKTRQSAVLILLYPHKDQVYFPCILRPQYDGVHAGQVAFPGGRQERTDRDLIQTALREAQEEIGIKAADVQILGCLTEIYIPPSNFNALPVVGYLNHKPDFYPDSREVDEILEISLSEISDESIVGTTEITVNGYTFEASYYGVHDRKIWGATALMISELLYLLR